MVSGLDLVTRQHQQRVRDHDQSSLLETDLVILNLVQMTRRQMSLYLPFQTTILRPVDTFESSKDLTYRGPLDTAGLLSDWA
ncbi:hypothetical protein TNCV_4360081 [Trichonephila clavipes]|uniref:Uncharacterized protein n=1 Tax=Trichonephila clavipes TaxID=2585209 RepID=A0A8X6WBA6_TRICX|nr:hypothetical protein TNCV_4360081 [Trichonephila clavipes]